MPGASICQAVPARWRWAAPQPRTTTPGCHRPVSTIDETWIPPLRLVDATAFTFTESYSIGGNSVTWPARRLKTAGRRTRRIILPDEHLIATRAAGGCPPGAAPEGCRGCASRGAAARGDP